jgi:hypothetical protein
VLVAVCWFVLIPTREFYVVYLIPSPGTRRTATCPPPSRCRPRSPCQWHVPLDLRLRAAGEMVDVHLHLVEAGFGRRNRSAVKAESEDSARGPGCQCSLV